MEFLMKSFWNTFEHVETHIDINFAVIISLFMLINLGYYLFDWYFTQNVGKSYTVLAFHRKRYVIKNILKSVYLLVLSMYTSVLLATFIINDDWSNYHLHTMGYMYMLPDLIALFRVPKLASATVQHHVTVVILTTLNLFCDYSDDTYWR